MAAPKTVQYVDLGFATAEQYWREVVLAAYERFRSGPNRVSAIEAAAPAWHVQEWIWHEENPGQDTRHNSNFWKFYARNISACPELDWISGVANASKHRGLGQPSKVRRVEGEQRFSGTIGGAPIGVLAIGEDELVVPMLIVLNDGTAHDFADVLSRVIDYWRRSKWFEPKQTNVAP